MNTHAISDSIHRHIVKVLRAGTVPGTNAAKITQESLLTVLEELRKNVQKLEDAYYYE